MNDSPTQCGVLLLAAGFSRRFGGIKLKAMLADGDTIFTKTLKNIRQVTDNIIVVGRKDLLDQGVYQNFPATPGQALVLCDDAEAGMGQSLACGIQQVPAEWTSVLICLADMPFVQPQTMTALMQQSREDRIVVPVFEHQRGQPVSFGKKFFAELAQSHGDTGGRHVLRDHAQLIMEFPTTDNGVLLDIDTPQTLEALSTRR